MAPNNEARGKLGTTFKLRLNGKTNRIIRLLYLPIPMHHPMAITCCYNLNRISDTTIDSYIKPYTLAL
jgi:hypothetical protein